MIVNLYVIFFFSELSDVSPTDNLKLWTDLTSILAEDGKHAYDVLGRGFVILESIQESLAQDYNVLMTLEELVGHMSEQLLMDPEFIRYADHPLTGTDIRATVRLGVATKDFGRLVTEMYLPALAKALDCHFQVIREVHGYIATVNTLPPCPTYNSKVVTLIWDSRRQIYMPVVLKCDNTVPSINSLSAFPLLPNKHTTYKPMSDPQPVRAIRSISNRLSGYQTTSSAAKPSGPATPSSSPPSSPLTRPTAKGTKRLVRRHVPSTSSCDSVTSAAKPSARPTAKRVKRQASSCSSECSFDPALEAILRMKELVSKIPSPNPSPVPTQIPSISTIPSTIPDYPAPVPTQIPRISPIPSQIPDSVFGKSKKKAKRSSTTSHVYSRKEISVIGPNELPDLVQPVDPMVISSTEEDDFDTLPLPDCLMPTSTSTSAKSVNQPIGSGYMFCMDAYKNIVPEIVEFIPWEIDGKKYYMIDVPESELYYSRTKDGRYFNLKTSSRKGFRGIRKIGQCIGSQVCQNPACPFLLTEGTPNSHQFTIKGSMKFCFTCQSLATRESCGAIKVLEFDKASRVLHVFHSGKHSCVAKPAENKEQERIVSEAISRYGTHLGPKEIAKSKMSEELHTQMSSGNYDMSKIVGIASSLCDNKQITNMRKKIDTELRSQKHSISAVAEVKTVTDTSDQALIYSMNDSAFNANPSFVFKSSRQMATLGINMGQNYHTANPLMEEMCYFDGMHSRCRGWKTLTLWVFHSSSRKLLRLATMEVKSENTTNCALFWSQWNKLLAYVKGDPKYKFNPCGFLTDEAGANFAGIREVYGDEHHRNANSCQFHYKQCLQRLLKKIPAHLADYRNEIEVLSLQFLTVSTMADYNSVRVRLQDLATINEDVQSWLGWWVARRFHIFPVFRGYCISSLNLAEIGHSTMKRKRLLMLVDAAWDDVCTMVLQNEALAKFIEGKQKSYGKGPSVAQTATREKRAQHVRAKDYVENFRRGTFEMSSGEEFVSSQRARHRAPATASVQGYNLPPVDSSSAPSTPVNLGHVTSAAARGLTPEQKQILMESPPVLTFCHGNMRKCYGCRGKFTADMRTNPNDMILKMMVHRDKCINGTWQKSWRKEWAYFHLNLNCIHSCCSFLELKDIYIPEGVREQLTPAHLELLRKKNWAERLGLQ